MIICFAGILFCANQQRTASEIVIDYARPTYTVSFDANGGTNTASKQVKLGDNYGTLPTTSRTGYTFSGWNGKNLVNIPNGNYGSYISVSNNVITVKKSTVSSTTTVFSALQLKPNTTYTVSCKIQGSFTGRIYAFLMRNGDSKASIYSNYLNSQGNFTCTYTTSDTGIDTDKGNITITQGSGTNSDLNMTSDQIVISNIMLCEGGAVPYEPYYVTSTTMNTTVGNHTLTARWTPKTYSIKLYENKNILYGGELTETQDLLAWEGSSYASIATEDGLSCAKISGALSTTKYVRQSILDRCQFNTEYIISAKAKVVNYVAGSTDPYLALYLDGSYNNNGKSTWYGFGGSTGISGYSGKGWQNIFSHFTSNSTATSSTATSAAVYLYARDFTGDVFFRDYSLALATNTAKSVTYDSAIAPVSALSRTGYTFQGYFTQPVGGTKIFNANGSVVKNVSGYTDSNGNWVRDEAINLYGQWKANSYTVTLDRQGGSGGTSSFTAKYNCKPSISIPSRSEHDFKGYYTSTNGGGTQYLDANGASTRVWNIASNTTLYAYWEQWPMLPSSAGATFVNTQAVQNSYGDVDKRVVQVNITSNASGTPRAFEYSWDGSSWPGGSSGGKIAVYYASTSSAGTQTLYVRVYPTGGEHYRGYVETSTTVYLLQLPAPQIVGYCSTGWSGQWYLKSKRMVSGAELHTWATGKSSDIKIGSDTTFTDDNWHTTASYSGMLVWMTESYYAYAYHKLKGFITSPTTQGGAYSGGSASGTTGSTTYYYAQDNGNITS